MESTCSGRTGVSGCPLTELSRCDNEFAGEIRIDFGPGYRVCFGKDGDSVVILLGGSSKKDQQQAIKAATKAWAAYKQSKRIG